MKTAVLISGIPRHLEKGYESLFESIIAPNNADVFIHGWLSPEKNDDINHVVNLYKPVRYLMEKPKIFLDSSMNLERMMNSWAKSYKRDVFLETTYSMWYGIQQVNLLKELYRLENNFVYDYVVRARFDLTFNIKINCQEYDSNIIHTATRILPPEMIDDRFAFSSNDLMNAYCGGFNYLNYIFNLKNKSDGIFCGETLTYEMLSRLDIRTNQISELICSHLNH